MKAASKEFAQNFLIAVRIEGLFCISLDIDKLTPQAKEWEVHRYNSFVIMSFFAWL